MANQDPIIDALRSVDWQGNNIVSRGMVVGVTRAKDDAGKATVILEIEPPADTLSRRRKRFYERLGLRENPYLHVQPPYQADCGPTRLVVMSRPALTRAEFARFSAFFHTRVTGYRDAP